MESGKPSETTQGEKKARKVTRLFWLVLGFICVGLGAIGIVLPILPTTPFVLAAAGCFCKSSPKMYNWLLNNYFLFRPSFASSAGFANSTNNGDCRSRS
jgi:hypothetical protein